MNHCSTRFHIRFPMCVEKYTGRACGVCEEGSVSGHSDQHVEGDCELFLLKRRISPSEDTSFMLVTSSSTFGENSKN